MRLISRRGSAAGSQAFEGEFAVRACDRVTVNLCILGRDGLRAVPRKDRCPRATRRSAAYLCHFERKNPLAHALPELYIACSHRSGVSTFGTEIPELELPGEKEIRVGTEAAKRGRL